MFRDLSEEVILKHMLETNEGTDHREEQPSIGDRKCDPLSLKHVWPIQGKARLPLGLKDIKKGRYGRK